MSVFSEFVKDTGEAISGGVNEVVGGAGEVISGAVEGGFNVFNEASRAALFGASFTEMGSFGQNLFSSLHGRTSMFTDWTGETLSSTSSGLGLDQWGRKISDLGMINLPQQTGGFGAFQPLKDSLDTGMGKLGPNINYAFNRVGDVLDNVGDAGEYLTETGGHIIDFLKDPADKLRKNKGGGGGGGGSSSSSIERVKGSGKLRGKSATLRLNKGMKSRGGRSSLKIGYGSGTGGACRKWRKAEHLAGMRSD